MNSRTFKTLGKKDLQDDMLRSRDTNNDDIGHEFYAMTSQK